MSEFDRHRLSLLAGDEEGWGAELRSYLKDMPADVTKDIDIVNWWQVRALVSFIWFCCSNTLAYMQDNCVIFPTLGRIALDVLAAQASFVPCEWLFSASKQTADDRRAHLGASRFEELQLMKFAWHRNITNLAAWNSGLVEEIDLGLYCDMLAVDEAEDDLDKNSVEMVMDMHSDLEYTD